VIGQIVRSPFSCAQTPISRPVSSPNPKVLRDFEPCLRLFSQLAPKPSFFSTAPSLFFRRDVPLLSLCSGAVGFQRRSLRGFSFLVWEPQLGAVTVCRTLSGLSDALFSVVFWRFLTQCSGSVGINFLVLPCGRRGRCAVDKKVFASFAPCFFYV